MDWVLEYSEQVPGVETGTSFDPADIEINESRITHRTMEYHLKAEYSKSLPSLALVGNFIEIELS